MGCLSCGNCLVVVPQDRYVAVEKFGKFTAILQPGLNYAGLDLCGVCIAFRSVTTRISQLEVGVAAKSKDHTFVVVRVAVQMHVKEDCAYEAMYKLTDVSSQVESYVSNVVRSKVAQLSLDDVFAAKSELAGDIEGQLRERMDAFGYVIIKVLV